MHLGMYMMPPLAGHGLPAGKSKWHSCSASSRAFRRAMDRHLSTSDAGEGQPWGVVLAQKDWSRLQEVGGLRYTSLLCLGNTSLN